MASTLAFNIGEPRSQIGQLRQLFLELARQLNAIRLPIAGN